MSDEIRDLLKRRADDVTVPAGDLGDVVRGGNARRWRNRAYSVGVVVLVAVVGWATVPGFLNSMRDDNDAPNIADTPTPGPTEIVTPEPAPCMTVPFRPTYLPDGWSYELQGSMNQYALGSYTTIDDDERIRPFVDVALHGNQYVLAPDAKQMPDVLGSEAHIGPIHEGYGVEFTYDGCDFSLNANGIWQPELRRIALSLRPTDTCAGAPVSDQDLGLRDGRHFGYIRAINLVAVEFDRAEFLSGNEANDAAVAAGEIEAGESVPNDYYIVNDDKGTGSLALSGDVKVFIETLQDGTPGLAPADPTWLICAFSDDDYDEDVRGFVPSLSPYWLTVRDGRVIEIEEQYLP